MENFRSGGTNIAANTAAILAEIFKSPLDSSYVDLDGTLSALVRLDELSLHYSPDLLKDFSIEDHPRIAEIRARMGLPLDRVPDSKLQHVESRILSSMKMARPAKVAALHPAFKIVFITIATITIGAIIAQILLAHTWAAPTSNQQQVFEALGFAWKTGIGAIFGLLGGKLT